MSDKVLTINLTEREIDLLHECISTNMETVKRRHDVADPMISDLIAELGELSDDLLEQSHRADDPDWSDGTTFMVAEEDFIQRGMDAREQAKAHSQAQHRRKMRAVAESQPSALQQHDLWEEHPETQEAHQRRLKNSSVFCGNDPIDW
jgi:hypothetical protein